MEIPVLLFALSVALFFCSWLFGRRTRLPPGPRGLPVVGSLLELGAQPHRSLAELAMRHGPLMTLRLGAVTTVVASSAEAAREILQRHDQSFSDRTIPDAVAVQPNPEATLAWVPGDHRWRGRRRVCSTQLFAAPRLDALQHLRREKVRELVAHVGLCAAAGKAVDVGRVAFATSLNLISNTIFSVDTVDPGFEKAQEFKDLVWRIMEDAGKANLSDYFPALRRFDLQGIRRHIRASYTRLHEIFDRIIDERVQSRANAEQGKGQRSGDFLDVLLDYCEEDGGSEFSRETIKPLILDLFIAGSDTSAITTEWAMAELLRHPAAMEKARAELAEAIGGGEEASEGDLERLPYLQAVVKETMRLHPAVPFLLPYKAKNDVEVWGYVIPAGTQVLVNAWALGRDSASWDDPDSFVPERFLRGPTAGTDFRGRDFHFIPFGAGRRICPGLPLGVRMVDLMLASLVHQFRWGLPGGAPPESIDMAEQYGVTVKKATPLLALPFPRQT